ncbi:beta-lactamase family protein [Verrucomicrobiales bacterium]|nr:beta-lactamase family protein [bacterium]MDA7673272.1 beta-lactamase family protein [Verrucomicrobiales bacterium]MDB4617612.1 beta-lactamase family protein [Verrucomicrobiales bacterium]MDB4657827.1 beta-lactamase family protein [Verrucomicrobiales bacterium]MDB4662988.1 beta-lactamase family protein [Verrucomicrobiales bacterium]
MKKFYHLSFAVVLVTLAQPVFGQAPTTAESLLTPFVEHSELAGAVGFVIGKGGELATVTVGFADIIAKKPMAADSTFWIASQSKPMTATAVMMLVDEGKIALDDPVEKYLPEFKSQMVIAEIDDDHVLLRKPVHPITIREVLSHVSGLPFKSAMEEPTLDGLPLNLAVRSYAAAPLATEPGTHFQYSNAGINTAARVLEVVSGMKYEDFMQRRLFDPLGMNDTTFWPSETQVERLAKSYRPNKTKDNLEEFGLGQMKWPLTDRTGRFPMPAGGLFSTAEDTATFCRMLLNGGELNGKRYISKAALAELSRKQTPDSIKNGYGLGFSVGGDSFGHGGAHATKMDIFPEQGIAVIWMVQHVGFPGEGKNAHGVFKNWAIQKFGK